MRRLQRPEHGAALRLYREGAARFPLVGAVLTDEQDGVVYADSAAGPKHAYVEHAFGFAQLLGEPTPEFEAALERHLLIEKRFSAPKVRLYTPHLPSFLEEPDRDGLRSWRQRFVMDPANFRGADGSSGVDGFPERDVVEVDAANVEACEQAFGVTRRFWRSAADFVAKANAVVVMNGGEPASICYAAALVDGEAEIDVFTRPGHQRLGLGKIAVTHFVKRCFERGLAPLWDCFANNMASMELSRSIGFSPKGQPYPFFTINK